MPYGSLLDLLRVAVRPPEPNHALKEPRCSTCCGSLLGSLLNLLRVAARLLRVAARPARVAARPAALRETRALVVLDYLSISSIRLYYSLVLLIYVVV